MNHCPASGFHNMICLDLNQSYCRPHFGFGRVIPDPIKITLTYRSYLLYLF